MDKRIYNIRDWVDYYNALKEENTEYKIEVCPTMENKGLCKWGDKIIYIQNEEEGWILAHESFHAFEHDRFPYSRHFSKRLKKAYDNAIDDFHKSGRNVKEMKTFNKIMFAWLYSFTTGELIANIYSEWKCHDNPYMKIYLELCQFIFTTYNVIVSVLNGIGEDGKGRIFNSI